MSGVAQRVGDDGVLRIGRARRELRATYRLQLHDGFTFAAAAAQVDRLAALGISHLYLSPSLEAVPGSTHGYDVIDPTRIRASLGGERGLRELAATAHAAGLGLILDIVPNHVGLVSPVNPWWFDTLAHGPEGRFGRHLDVHWVPGAHGQPTLLVPELGERLPAALAGDALQLAHVDDGRDPAWRIVYHDHQWPVRPGSLAQAGVLDPAADPHGTGDAEVARAVAACREDRGLLARLLDHQHYRLGYWKRANAELDHRRFFDIDTLGAVRIEDPAVFDDVHAAVLPLIADGTLDGLRIDHPDGLADPVGYLRRLRGVVGPDAWLIVEKILEHGERFRSDWPADGTVGYEFADLALKIHVDPAAGAVLDDLQTSLTGASFARDHEADEAKRTALETLFGAERARLAEALLEVAPDLVAEVTADSTGDPAADPAADVAGGVATGATPELAAADTLLTELLLVWPVYRTYVREPAHDGARDGGEPDDALDGVPVELSDADVAVIAHALARVGARHPDRLEAYARIGAILRGEVDHPAAATFRTRFQQLTGPAIAKGLEDTVLYRDLRFTAVNEVGSDPGHLDVEAAHLHALQRDAAHERPATMRLLSTHDTKRSADVRARLAVLGQDPGWWVAAVVRLREATRTALAAAGVAPPAPVHEHLAWQTALGTWPIDGQRLGEYLVKAAREGKRHTNWLDPDADYETSLQALADVVTGDATLRARFDELVDEVAEAGRATSLAMLLTTVCGPGVPDIYQGEERWAHHLVDPDNRRDVDHDACAALVAATDGVPTPARAAAPWADASTDASTGAVKAWVLRRALRVRAEHPEAFGPRGGYEPVWAEGDRAEHVFAFLRGGRVLPLVATRVRQLGERHERWRWRDTVLPLPEGTWHDVLTGRRHRGRTSMGELLTDLPVALLVREAAGHAARATTDARDDRAGAVDDPGPERPHDPEEPDA